MKIRSVHRAFRIHQINPVFESSKSEGPKKQQRQEQSRDLAKNTAQDSFQHQNQQMQQWKNLFCNQPTFRHSLFGKS